MHCSCMRALWHVFDADVKKMFSHFFLKKKKKSDYSAVKATIAEKDHVLYDYGFIVTHEKSMQTRR